MRAEREKFLHNLLPAVLRLRDRSGLPASAVLAQAILESGWGRSRLARRNRNLFGIKAHRRTAAGVYTTTEYRGGKRRREKARFAHYDSYDACLADYARLLARPRYAPAREVAHDPFAFVRALRRCGYATDPRYAQKLATLIRRYNLTQYDAARGSADVPSQPDIT